MQKVIYKYSISSRDIPELLTNPRNAPFKIQMVKGAEIIAVATQAEFNEQGIPQETGKIWCLCDPEQEENAERQFVLMETGKVFDKTDNMRHIGTYQLYGGQIVLHLFEIT